MNENKKTALYRWCVYQVWFLVGGLILRFGVFVFESNHIYRPHSQSNQFERIHGSLVRKHEFVDRNFSDYSVFLWILVFTLPAIWVWRKPLMRLGSFLNRVADDDSK